MRKGYADTRFGQIHYVLEGSGAPILLFHCTPYSSCEYTRVLPFLGGKEFQAIAVDTIGYGSSDKPSRTLTTIAEYAQTMVDLMDYLKIKKANVLGFHTGCTIAAEVAAGHPEHVDRLILCGYPWWDEQQMALRMELQRQGTVIEGLRQPVPKEDGSHMLSYWKPYGISLEHAQENAIALMQAGDPPRAYEAWYALYAYPSEKRLPLIKSPTVALYARGDIGFLPHADKVKRLIKGVRVEVVEAPGMFPRERPQLFAETVIGLLKEMQQERR